MAPPNSLPPPPDFIAAAASRIYHGAPARQSNLTAAAEKVTAARLRGLILIKNLAATCISSCKSVLLPSPRSVPYYSIFAE